MKQLIRQNRHLKLQLQSQKKIMYANELLVCKVKDLAGQNERLKASNFKLFNHLEGLTAQARQ